MIIDGKAVAARIKREVAQEVERLPASRPAWRPCWWATTPRRAIYVRMKREDCAEVGIESFHHELPGDVEPDELAGLLRELNADSRVHGILLQLPLPDHLDQDEFIAADRPGQGRRRPDRRSTPAC